MTTATARIRTAGAGLGQRLRILVRGTARSATRRTLLGLAAGLLVVTVVVFITTLLAFTRARHTAETVRARTVPAIVQLTVARAALIRADNAAISSFQTHYAQLTGPGDEFRTHLAPAGQSLTQVVESNVAGEASRSDLQLVEGLLVTYTSMIGQADAHFEQSGGTTLGAVDLWSASRLLHETILLQLDNLLDAQKGALNRQIATSSLTSGAVLVLLLPVIGALVLLVTTQITLWRRFRRRVNPGLAVATLLLVALSAVSSSDLVVQHRLKESRSTLYKLAADRMTQMYVR